MKKLLLFIALISFGITQAQIVNIPDANFKNALLNYDPIIDTNNDNEIQISEAEAYTGGLFYVNYELVNASFGVSDCEALYPNGSQDYYDCIDLITNDTFLIQSVITDLTGLEAFINVTHIALEYVSHTNSLIISNFNNLETFKIVFTDVIYDETFPTNINLSNNANLKKVTINNANDYDPFFYGLFYNLLAEISIPNLNISNSNNLELLDVKGLNIPSIDVYDKLELLDFDCSNNNLQNIDVSQSINLTNLNCNFNDLTNLNVNNNINLTNLNCSFNDLTNLNVNNNTNLINLNVSNNDLTNLNVNNNYLLKSLRFRSNLISEIDLNDIIDLRNLNCIDNLLNTINISNFNNFNSINCSNNPNLSYLNLKNGNNINFNVPNGANFGFGNLPNLEIVCVDDINSDLVMRINNDVGHSVNYTEYCSLEPALSNQINGNSKSDINNNGCDATDAFISNLMILSNNGTDNFATFTQTNGEYLLYTNEGDFTTEVTTNLPNILP